MSVFSRLFFTCFCLLMLALLPVQLFSQQTEEQPAAETTATPENPDESEATMEGEAEEVVEESEVADEAQADADKSESAEEDDGATETSQTPAASGPGRAEFEAQFTKWKQIIKELRDIKMSYQLAEEGELSGLRDQWTTQLEAGEALMPALRDATLAAYLEAPNADREISRLLIQMAADQIAQENYPAAKAILQKLFDNRCDERGLDDLMGRAAFGTNDFELAEEHLTEADRSGTLSEQGQKFFDAVTQVKANWEDEVEIRAAEAEADEANKLPRVKFETSAGDIVLELFENEAPETVGNFISLVEKGFYDGLTFHRVLEGFMAQGGCPNGDGSGGPGYKIYCECLNDDHRNHFAGSISMAKETARHTGGSQFFLTFVPTPHLDGQHTVFGRIAEGMDVLPKITKVDPEARRAQKDPTTITKAVVLNKRDHEYRPNKVK